MSGSKFERENIVTDALSADPATKPFEIAREHEPSRTYLAPAGRRSVRPVARKRIPAASASSPTSRARSRIRSSPTRSRFCAISNIAARSAPIRAPATAPASWCRSRTRFFARKAKELGFTLPAPGEYAVGALFMPRDTAWRQVIESIIAEQIKAERLTLLGWRDVPTDNSSLGESVKPTEPVNLQVFIGRGDAHQERGRVRAPALHSAQDDFARDLSAPRPRPRRLLSGVAVVPHRRLQGHVPRRPARQLLSRTCTTRISRARSRWCISASRPTPSRPGRWRIPIAWSRIMAKSTRCAATSTGWRRGRPRSQSELFGNDINQALADLLRGPVGHRLLRQCARIPRAGRLFAAARGDDADSGSLGRQSADG